MDENNVFIRPDRPFMVADHFNGDDCEMRVNWFETEEDALDFINGYKKDFADTYIVDDFIEIGSCREIGVK